MAVTASTVVGCVSCRHGSQGDRISAGVGMMKVRHKHSNKITGGWAAEVCTIGHVVWSRLSHKVLNEQIQHCEVASSIPNAMLVESVVQVATLLCWTAAHIAQRVCKCGGRIGKLRVAAHYVTMAVCFTSRGLAFQALGKPGQLPRHRRRGASA